MSRLSKLERHSRRLVDVVFGALIILNGSIAITALVALALSGGDFVSPLLWRCAGNTIVLWVVFDLIRDNRRLRDRPAWRQAVDSFSEGYAQGVADGRRRAERDGGPR